MSNARTTPVELIAESEPRFAEEEDALLLVRLRAVTFLLSAGLALVLVRDLLFGRGPVWPFQAAATVVFMVSPSRVSGWIDRSGPGLADARPGPVGVNGWS